MIKKEPANASVTHSQTKARPLWVQDIVGPADIALCANHWSSRGYKLIDFRVVAMDLTSFLLLFVDNQTESEKNRKPLMKVSVGQPQGNKEMKTRGN